MVTLVKQAKAHVIIALFLLLRLFFLLLLCSRSISGGRRCSNSERRWVGQICLQLFNLREGNISLNGNSSHILKSIDDRVWYRHHSRITNLKGHGGYIGNSLTESGHDVIISDVEDARIIAASLLKHLGNLETIRERHNLQHSQQSGLRSSNLLVLLNQMDVIQ